MFGYKLYCNLPICYLQRIGVLVLSILVSSGCTTYGTIHVGQPQIHTRDRLVAERHDEAAWLKTKLRPENLATVGNQVDGYRDLRVFTGIFARIDAELDPEAEGRKELEIDTAEAEAEAAFWEAKAKANAAKEAFENPAQNETAGEAPTTQPAASNTTTTDVTTTEYLRDFDGNLVKDSAGNPFVTKEIKVDEAIQPVTPDQNMDSKIAEAAKKAATEAVAAVKETADEALTKANEAKTKVDEASTAPTKSRFSEADVTKALAAPDPKKSMVTPSPLSKLHDQMAYRGY